MIRVPLPILGCIALASAFTPRTQADDSSALHKSHDERLLVTPADTDITKWDVVVYKYPSDPNHNYIKRLIGLPGETMEIDHGQLCPADDVIDTIKAQGARIEVTPEAIRIEGGNVEIRRTRSRK